MNDWIKLFRKMTSWEWYKDSYTKSVFIHFLLNANREATSYKGIDIPPYSLVVGRKQLGLDLGIPEQSIRTSLKRLKSTNEITIKTTNKFSIITVVNYEKYQINSRQPTNEITNNPPTTNHSTRNKEIKNNKYIVEQVIDYMNKLAQTKFRSTTKSTIKHINARLSEGFKLSDFKKVIFLKYHEWYKKPIQFLNKIMSDTYYRPETLFSSNFEGYLQEAERKIDFDNGK